MRILEESSRVFHGQSRRATSDFRWRCVRGNMSEALKTLHQRDGSAWLGRDLRQVGTGASLDSNISAMSRARVWTDSFAVAAHIQREAIAKEGPMLSEELFQLLETDGDTKRRLHAVCAEILRSGR